MKRQFLFVILGAAIVASLAQPASNPFVGRWDITVTSPNGTYPDWMEVTDDGGSLAARVQPRGGSVHPAAAVKMDAGHLFVTVSAASGNRPEVTWDLTINGDQISGAQKRGDANIGQLLGVRAPAMHRTPPKSWGPAVSIFDGRDLTGWEPDNAGPNHWVARDGVLLNESHGANLKTTRKFDDFKLHVEFNCPDGGNSGIYLRGRYEIQVEYEKEGTEDKFHSMGAVYGMVPVTADLPRRPGQWESFDVTLVGRNVTIVRDGVKIIDNQEIAGITGGALDANEDQPGPFYIQGDHTGGMMYRNITVAEPRR